MNGPVGIVAGSGIALESLLDERDEERPFSSVPELAWTKEYDALPGHAHRFIFGACGNHAVIVQCGRLHLYEGLAYDAVVQTVDALHARGVRTVLFTNAAGGLKPGMQPGDLVAVERVRLCRYNGWHATPGVLFTDFVVSDCDFGGTYQWVPGPCYETQAEISAIQRLGAEVVGMSTAPELMRCQELGIRAGIVACITNSCCRPERLTHDRVVAAARKASAKLAAVIRRAVPACAAGEAAPYIEPVFRGD